MIELGRQAMVICVSCFMAWEVYDVLSLPSSAERSQGLRLARLLMISIVIVLYFVSLVTV